MLNTSAFDTFQTEGEISLLNRFTYVMSLSLVLMEKGFNHLAHLALTRDSSNHTIVTLSQQVASSFLK